MKAVVAQCPAQPRKEPHSSFPVRSADSMTKSVLLIVLLLPATLRAQQYVAFDAASATSTYSAGNLAGSSAFAAQQALSGGSGYWHFTIPSLLHACDAQNVCIIFIPSQVLERKPQCRQWRHRHFVVLAHDATSFGFVVHKV